MPKGSVATGGKSLAKQEAEAVAKTAMVLNKAWGGFHGKEAKPSCSGANPPLSDAECCHDKRWSLHIEVEQNRASSEEIP